MAPPATPTPHRFLVPKRSQPGSDTPKPAGSQQFQATPRFSAARASTAHQQRRDDFVIDSSPPAPSPVASRCLVYDGDTLIEGDDVVCESPAHDEDENENEDDEHRAKRRRISETPPWDGASSPDVEMRDSVEIESSLPLPPTMDNDADSDADADDLGDDVEVSKGKEKQTHRATQPTFQKAPRFKPAETSDAFRPEPLPDAFSPRRKGPKYVAGGLAAEVRNWLVDVEAGVGAGSMTTANQDGEWTFRIRVDELRGGGARGMTLVLGRRVLREKTHGEDAGEETDALDANPVKLILAGPGRLSGLGVGNNVTPGVTVGIARPTWEVVLDGQGRWGVACDWAVLR